MSFSATIGAAAYLEMRRGDYVTLLQELLSASLKTVVDEDEDMVIDLGYCQVNTTKLLVTTATFTYPCSNMQEIYATILRKFW